ncbi:short chain dehydrogenase [Enterococcus sp. 5H]|uniref:short chain dehydrogenase n=1 Tax=Enterococcus sp. 5H TaxID=1229490 RepID=UPI0023038BC0|nr:short chain dehydrogenase [Enterococcus sp. 5H]MDA9470084.1 short chain dehydrogenase [Enterococcus sp. 5H]
MKLLLIGHTGTLGTGVYNYFADKEEVITASRSKGDVQVDITDPKSIQQMFDNVGKVDAIISTAGATTFEPLNQLTPEKNHFSIMSKLEGQVNLVLIGQHFLNPNGSITLTSGILMDEFIPTGTSSAMVNGALTSFVKAASLECQQGIRINAVSPNALLESWSDYQDYFKGFVPVAIKDVIPAFEKSIYGIMTGETFKVY